MCVLIVCCHAIFRESMQAKHAIPVDSLKSLCADPFLPVFTHLIGHI